MPFTTTIYILTMLQSCRIETGPLEGSFRTAPAGILSWYFSNLGLTVFA